MLAKRYASVIEGLSTLLDLKDKNQMDLDYNLISNLTYSVLNKQTVEEKCDDSDIVEVVETPLDDSVFDRLNATLSGLEEKLDEEYEEEEEEKKDTVTTENERQFLLKKLAELFDKLQKMVREKREYND